MRMRNKPWAKPFLEENRDFVINQPEECRGHWNEILSRECLHVEIGSGKGDYFVGMGTMYVNQGWIGIERNINVAALAVKKALAQEHANMRFIAQDADDLTEWFEQGEIDVIHLNFSDPWPKKGHQKRRLSHSGYLKKYESLLKQQGKIMMKTDNSGLFEFSLLQFAEAGWMLEEVSVNYRREPHAEDTVTEYESKFMALGQPIYRAVWRKPESASR